MFNYKKFGFTLAETLITMTIIGVVAAITVPVLNNHNRWIEYRTGTLKALSTLDQANIQYRIKKGHIARCGYWITNPYGGATCTERNAQGDCSKYQLNSGGDLPSDYNGNFRDCRDLYNAYPNIMNISKVCSSNAYANGCIPDYDGNDTLYKAKNSGATDYDATAATSGCGGFRKNNIKNGAAIVLNDGMIMFPYGNFWSGIMAVDVNGQRGPNKWGYDIRVFYPKMANKTTDAKYYPGGCELIAPGGKSTYDLLYKDTNK